MVDEGLLRALKALSDLIYVSDGDPNTVVEASPPAVCLNKLGGAGTTLYVKESGVRSKTGWVPK